MTKEENAKNTWVFARRISLDVKAAGLEPSLWGSEFI